jgi:hypothetical protein
MIRVSAMPRYFNTTGPCRAELHYMLPPEERLPALLPLVEQELYFVIHAARQTGKTTAAQAFAARLRGLGYVAVHATLETSQGADSVEEAEPRWMSSIQLAAGLALPPEQQPPPYARTLSEPPGERLRRWLSAWSAAVAPSSVVLLLDEADVLRGPALISLLRQLRAGFMTRGVGRFPVSIGLIGMRDLRDYLAEARDGSPANSGSPFNIKAESLTLRDFAEAEVAQLYGQHTADTGQVFLPEAVERAFYWTQGQPFLVNALAREAVMRLVTDPAQPVRASHIDASKERLILSRTTHLDNLVQRLREPRVARIVQAALTGDITIDYSDDDFQYVVDLGLIRRGPGGAEAANPLYREVLARQIAYNVQENIPRPEWRWRTADGRLDFPALVDAFLAWWRENADALVEDIPHYPEAVPHIAFMAFLQRVVNGGGTIQREYAAGRRALDLLVSYGPDRFVVEIKRVRERDSLERVRESAVQQTVQYLDLVGEKEAWVLIFDQRPGLGWEERLWAETREVEGRRLGLRGG